MCKSNPEVWYKFYRSGCRKSQKKKMLLRYEVTVQALRSTITPSKKVKKKSCYYTLISHLECSAHLALVLRCCGTVVRLNLGYYDVYWVWKQEPGCCYICLWLLQDGAQKICYYFCPPDGQQPMVAPLPQHIKVTSTSLLCEDGQERHRAIVQPSYI